MSSTHRRIAFVTGAGNGIGRAFGLFYANVGLPVAWLCDNYNRRNIIAASLGIFSLMTALCGQATGFMSLFLARVGVGIGEAGGSPPSQSMISDYFPPERRAAAMGFFFMYLPLGTLVGYLVGGWVNQFFGWRETFMVLGIPGVILALLLFFVLREPPRGFSENRSVSGPSPSLWSTIRYFMSVPSLRLLPLAGAVHGIGAWGAQLWLPAYFTRVHHMSSGEIGTWFALIFGLGVPRRAMGAAFYLFLSNLISMGVGPLLIGATSDYFTADYGHLALRYSLLTLVCSTSILAAILFSLTARNLRQDLDAVDLR